MRRRRRRGHEGRGRQGKRGTPIIRGVSADGWPSSGSEGSGKVRSHSVGGDRVSFRMLYDIYLISNTSSRL